MGTVLRRVIAGLLCATALILLVLPSSQIEAVTSQHGDFIYDGSTIKKYVGSDMEVTIPSNVSEIGKDAFSGNTNLVKVIIPDNVRTIDYAAFENCINLQKVEIGNGVRTIGSSAFSGCINLQSINFDSKLSELGSGVFAGCTSLSNVNIDPLNKDFMCADGVIYSSDMSKLYMYLPGRTHSVYKMPDYVNTIGEYSFWGSDKLTDVSVSNGVSVIPEYSFANCKALTNVRIPSSVNAIERCAFADCDNLRNVTIPNSVSSIDSKAFESTDGSGVKLINTSQGAESIPKDSGDDGAVAENQGLSNADVDDSGDTNNGTSEVSVADISDTDAGTIDSVVNDTDNTYADMNIPATVSQNDSKTLSKDYSDNKFENELGSGKIVGGNALVMMSPDIEVLGFDLNDAETEDSIANIGANTVEMFNTDSNASGVFGEYKGDNSEVNIDDGYSKIGNRAFYNNPNITSVKIPSSVNELGDFSFARSNIGEIVIPDGVKKIGYAAFYQCPNLETVAIPDSVTDIELGAFEGSKWLDNWKNNNDGSEYLVGGDGILLAYKGATDEVLIPEGIKIIGPGAFAHCTSVRKLIIPEGCSAIGEEAFNGCVNLAAVNLPDSLNYIEDRAFYNTSLSTVVIPENVQSIGLGAFDNSNPAKGLQTIVLEGQKIPNVSYNDTATRLSAKDLRSDALGKCDSVVVKSNANIDSGTLLNPLYYGFHGNVYSINPVEDRQLNLLRCLKKPSEDGTVCVDSQVKLAGNDYMISGTNMSAFNSYLNWQDWCDVKPSSVSVNGNATDDLNNLLSSLNLAVQSTDDTDDIGIKVNVEGNDFPKGTKASAVIDGNDNKYTLNVVQDGSLRNEFEEAYKEVYGSYPEGAMITMDMSMFDSSGTIPIHKLGNSKMEVMLPMPAQFVDKDGLKVLSINDNGKLEELAAESVTGDNGSMLRFVASHLSPYAIYLKQENSLQLPGYTTIESISGDSDIAADVWIENNLAGNDGDGEMKELSKNRYDIFSVKNISAVILLLLSGILLLYKNKRVKEK